jgi:hypothetical protein
MALEAGKMGAWDWSLESGVVKWSATLEAIHGLAPGAFGGRFEDYLKDIHPDDLARVRAAIQQSAEGKGDHDMVPLPKV